MANGKSTLPLGVSTVANREGLYRLSVMISGKRYSEYYRPDEKLTQRQLQSTLQKAIDAFREKAERGSLHGQITDKSTLCDAAVWYYSTVKLERRASTMELNMTTFDMYIAPTLGSTPVRSVTTPMVSQLFADLLDHGGGESGYYAKPSFLKLINSTGGSVKAMSIAMGLGENALYRIRKPNYPAKLGTAQKTAAYFGHEVGKAFDYKREPRPLSAVTVNRIANTLSAIFTSLVRAEVLTRNPVANAVKPQIGEQDRGAYLDNAQLRIFVNALELIEDGNIRIALTLMLQLGLRSGEARGLRWIDIDFQRAIVSINTAAGKVAGGWTIGQPKTKRSIRKLPLSPYLHSLLLEHRDDQAAYALSIGSMWKDNGLVVTNTTGGIVAPTKARDAVQRIIKAHPELPPDLHPHSLRHSFVTLLIASGLDTVTVASLAGDTVDIITHTYAHALKEREAAAMDAIGGVFARIAAAPAPPLIPAVMSLT